MNDVSKVSFAVRVYDASAFLRDRLAVTAVEYGIVAAFLCLSLLGIFTKFGTVIAALFVTATSGL